MRARLRLALALAVALTLLSAIPVTAHTEGSLQGDLDTIDRKIEAFETDIESAEGERSVLADQVVASAGRLTTLKQELAGAEAALTAVEADIAASEAERDRVRRQLDTKRGQLARTRLAIGENRDLLQQQAVELYIEGGVDLGTIVLSASQMDEVSIGLEYAARLLASSEQLINTLEVLRLQAEAEERLIAEQERTLTSVLDVLAGQRAEAAQHKADVEARRDAVAAEYDHQHTLLHRVEDEIAHIEGEIAALEAEAAEIEAEIKRLQAASTVTPSASSGALAWPTSGPVTSPYGYRIHPILGYKKLHTGIDISGPTGQAIVAAEDGVVILAAWYGGYGNATIVDHGGGVATLYAHQSAFGASVGQSVSRGEVIGYVGSTGFSTGPHLHFEVRIAGSPVDPMPYLR